jgi:adenylate kinase
MNIFVAGIHGVGKTYLASRAATFAGMMHTSASKLIKEERALLTWSKDKQVIDVDENQLALATAVRRHNTLGARLLLDGHFVLLGESDELILLGDEVFSTLNLCSVILVEEDLQTVAQRIADRDQRKVSTDHMHAFMMAERDQAQKVCSVLHIPLIILVSPLLEEFVASVSKQSGVRQSD